MTTAPPARFRPRKALGQHFLADNLVLNQVVAAADIAAGDVVLEVGPGLGSLTRRLVERGAQVIAVEIDPALAAALAARLGNPSNLVVVEGDARTIDLASLVGPERPYKVVANLPYYAANPIIRRFLESSPKPRLMVVMVQEEVARSMVAGPGKMNLLSVAIQYYAVPSLVATVPPRAFRPPPKVASAILRLDLRPSPAVEAVDEVAFFNVVRAGFSAPRKQLRNSLSLGLRASPAAVGSLLETLGLDGSRRPATLSLEEWALILHGWERVDQVGSPSLRQD